MEYAFCSENITNLSKALIKVQKNLQPVAKDSVNPFVKNRYCSLNAVMDSCRGALLDNGIVLMQYAVPVEGENLGLVTKLIHSDSGEHQGSLAIIPLARNDAQGLGSAMTYGRRYGLMAMLGLTADDDDGNLASNISAPPKKQSSQTGKRVSQETKRLSSMLSELGLADFVSNYRLYLEERYQCTPEHLTAAQYDEQKSLLTDMQDKPIQIREFARLLRSYK